MTSRIPLSPFEESMLIDDSAAFPMHIWVKMRLSGRIDRERLNRAANEALQRHVLLRSYVPDERRPAWNPQEILPDRDTLLDWQDDHSWPISPPIELATELPIRLALRVNEDSAELAVQAHHASVDGLGLLQFLGDLWANYMGSAPSPPPDDSLLKGAKRFGISFFNAWRHVPGFCIGLAGVRQYLQRTPLVFARHANEREIERFERPAAESRMVSRETTLAIHKAAKRAQVKVNDWLACELFRAVAECREKEEHEHEPWLRMIVPLSMRLPEIKHPPAANIVSMVFLDRTPRQIADRNELLHSVESEMSLCKRHRLGIMWLLSLGVGAMLPGGLRAQTKKQSCLGSLVFTNLTRVFHDDRFSPADHGMMIGDLEMTGLEFLAPIRNNTPLAFAAYEFVGRLGFSLHYDSRLIAHDRAANLADRYHALLNAVAS